MEENSKEKKTVKLQTFLSWKATDIGYTTFTKGETVYVNKVWCKVCVANKGKLYQHTAVKGATKEAAQRYIDGTDFVTKHTVRILFQK